MMSEVGESMERVVNSFNKHIDKKSDKESIWKTVDQIAVITDKSKLVVYQTVNSHASFIENRNGKYTTLYAYNTYSPLIIKYWNKFLKLFKNK